MKELEKEQRMVLHTNDYLMVVSSISAPLIWSGRISAEEINGINLGDDEGIDEVIRMAKSDSRLTRVVDPAAVNKILSKFIIAYFWYA